MSLIACGVLVLEDSRAIGKEEQNCKTPIINVRGCLSSKKKKNCHNFCSNSRNTLKFCMIIEYIPKDFCGKNFQKKIHNGGLNCENSFFGGL